MENQEGNNNYQEKIKFENILFLASRYFSYTLNKYSLLEKFIYLLEKKMFYLDFSVFLINKGNLFLETIKGECAVNSFIFVISNNIAHIVLNARNVKFFNNLSGSGFFIQGSILSIPMISIGKIVGVLNLYFNKKIYFINEYVKFFNHFCSQLALFLLNVNLYASILQKSTLDSLTGLLNKEKMYNCLKNELFRIRKTRKVLAFFMIDIDFFKKYNDRMGHVLGDIILKKIGNCIQQSIKKFDSLARFGGDEFCLVLPSTNIKKGLLLAKKLLLLVSKIEIKGRKKQPLGSVSVSVSVSISIGCVFHSVCPGPINKDMDITLIGLADKALYKAKNAGKNCIKFYKYYK